MYFWSKLKKQSPLRDLWSRQKAFGILCQDKCPQSIVTEGVSEYAEGLQELVQIGQEAALLTGRHDAWQTCWQRNTRQDEAISVWPGRSHEEGFCVCGLINGCVQRVHTKKEKPLDSTRSPLDFQRSNRVNKRCKSLRRMLWQFLWSSNCSR